jgi:hypothetical protein
MIITPWHVARACYELLTTEAASLSLPFSAVLQLRPRVKVEDLEQLTVTVVPQMVKTSPHDRVSSMMDITIAIGVQQRCKPEDEARVEQLTDFAAELGVFWRHTRLLNKQVAWRESQTAPLFDHEHLDQMNVFSSVIGVKWSVVQ